MLLLDVNVVLAVHRADHPDHGSTRPWFDALVAGRERFGVPDLVWTSFLRLSTNRRVFSVPTPLADAFGFIDAVCAQPAHLRVGPGPRHLALLRRACDEAGATGDLIPDAVLVAIALEHGADIVTFDRDFARFPSIEHRPPAAQ